MKIYGSVKQTLKVKIYESSPDVLQMSPPCGSNWLYNKHGNSKFSGP